jgi:hypothetical protein
MLTAIRCVLGLVVVLVGCNQPAIGDDVAPRVRDGVEFRAEDDPDQAWLRAIDARSGKELWKVKLIDEKKPKIVGLIAIDRGVIVMTEEGSPFFVDATTHEAEQVLDFRSRGKTHCDVHHRATVLALAPIHYGLARGNPLSKEAREKYPLADRPIEGGCCVRPEKTAMVLVCPDCR